MERNQNIDVAKGIAIICVVLFHASARTNPTLYYHDYLDIPEKLLYSFIMPFFFMVSAVFVRKRLEHVNFSSTSYLKKITSSMLKPFYTISLLFFSVKIALPKSAGIPSAIEMIKGMLFLQSNGEIMPSGVLWFLFALFVYALITFIFIKVFKVNIYILFLISVLFKLANMEYFEYSYYFAINKISYHYVFYIAGYMLSGHIVSSRIFSGSILTFFFSWITAFYIVHVVQPRYIINITAIGAVGIFGSLFILDLAYKINKWVPSSATFLAYCGANSLLIYVFHTPVILFMKTFNNYAHLHESIWGYVLEVVFGTLIPLIFGKILSYNASIYKLLIGRNP